MAYSDVAILVISKLDGRDEKRTKVAVGTVVIDNGVLRFVNRKSQVTMVERIDEFRFVRPPSWMKPVTRLQKGPDFYDFTVGPMWLRAFGLIGAMLMRKRGERFVKQLGLYSRV